MARVCTYVLICTVGFIIRWSTLIVLMRSDYVCISTSKQPNADMSISISISWCLHVYIFTYVFSERSPEQGYHISVCVHVCVHRISQIYNFAAAIAPLRVYSSNSNSPLKELKQLMTPLPWRRSPPWLSKKSTTWLTRSVPIYKVKPMWYMYSVYLIILRRRNGRREGLKWDHS